MSDIPDFKKMANGYAGPSAAHFFNNEVDRLEHLARKMFAAGLRRASWIVGQSEGVDFGIGDEADKIERGESMK